MNAPSKSKKKREPIPEPERDAKFRIIQCNGSGPHKRAKPSEAKPAKAKPPTKEASVQVGGDQVTSSIKDPLEEDLIMDQASVDSDRTPVVLDETTTILKHALSVIDPYTTLSFWKRLNYSWYCMILQLVTLLFPDFLKDPWLSVNARMLRSRIPQAIDLVRKKIHWAPNPEHQLSSYVSDFIS